MENVTDSIVMEQGMLTDTDLDTVAGGFPVGAALKVAGHIIKAVGIGFLADVVLEHVFGK